MPWEQAFEGGEKEKAPFTYNINSPLLSIDNITRLDRKPYNTYGALDSSLPLIDIATRRDAFPQYPTETYHLGLF